MFNTFSDEKIIPDTRYLLDKLFNAGENVQYHAVCPTCKSYVSTFNRNQKTVFCNVCEEDINLKDPSYRDYFVVFDIQKEFQNLLETNDDYYSNVINEREQGFHDEFKDFHNGQKYKEFVEKLPDDRKRSYATATISADGSPTFKGSKFSIWPIQVVVNEVPINVRNKKPIVYSLWFGHEKPNMTYFLDQFVESVNNLSTNGIRCTIKNEEMPIYLYAVCACADGVAQPTMQGMIQFNGRYGCSWCLHPGVEVLHDKGTARKYTVQDEIPRKRTEEETLQHMQEAMMQRKPIFGVKNPSALLKLEGFNIIDSFVPDFQHGVDFGSVKQITEYWFGISKKPYSIPKLFQELIAKYVAALKVPDLLGHLSRSLLDRRFWNSKEFQNWLLFYSLPALSVVPNFEKYITHWALLVEAMHILLKDSITLTDLRRAHKLLKQFVGEVQLNYTADAMTFNIHKLLHLVQSVLDWGPLWCHCTYPFESGCGCIKRMVQAAKGVLHQVIRNIARNECVLMLEKKVSLKPNSPVTNYCRYIDNRTTQSTIKIGDNRYFGKPLKPGARLTQELNLSEENSKVYHKLVTGGCLYKTCEKVNWRSNNSFARTKDGTFIQLVKFIIDVDKE